MKKRLVQSIAITAIFLILFTTTHAAWYSSNWLYRKAITIDSSKVSADLTNFPVLISLPVDSDLASHALADANDILFTSSDGSTKLSHEIEDFNSETGELVAWVKVPTLSSTTDTTIYLYYGNSSASSQQDAGNVWDANYVLVQHLNESPSNGVAGHLDSTSHENTGTPYNFNDTSGSTTDATGKINGADEFDGTDDYVEVPDSANLRAEPFTIELWFKWDGLGTNNVDFLTAKGSEIKEFHTGGGSGTNGIRFIPNGYAGSNVDVANIIHSGWNYLVGIFTGSETYVYADGELVGSRTGITPEFDASTDTTNFFLGQRANGTYRFNGSIDEVRMSNKVRDGNWISTEYNNQSSPSTFYSLGSEEGQIALSSWSYRKAITIDSSKVPSDQTNFPVLISLPADSDLASHAQSDGNDILFTLSSVSWNTGKNTDKLSHEIEDFNSETGELVAWVKVPTLSSTTDTTIYLYYGNSSASSQQDAGNVWDANYVLVQHMGDETTSSIDDSTSNNNNGTKKGANEPIEENGKIGKDQNFDGVDDYIDCGNDASLEIYGTNKPVTLEAWVKFNDTGTNVILIHKGTYPTYEYGFALSSVFDFRVNDDGTFKTVQDKSSVDTNWHHWVGVYNTSQLLLYKDGILVNSVSHSGIVSQDTYNLIMGHYGPGSYWFNGSIDEVRISNVARSTEWIQTEYNNQSDPEDFYSLGPEENYSAQALSSWSYRKKITIDSGMIAADLTDFPVLINLPADVDLVSKARSDGNDIVFVPSTISWSSATTNDRYCFEIEDYNSETGKLVAWVKIPKLSSSTDTTLYVYYGNSTATANLQNRCTWDSHYVMVQHLNESPANGVAGHLDSTFFRNDGTPYNFDNNADSNTSVTGKANGADIFDGTNDYVDIPDNLSLGVSNLTVELWLKWDGTGNAANRQYLFDGRGHKYMIFIDEPSTTSFVVSADGTYYGSGTVTFSMPVGQWVYVAGTYDGAALNIYKDGVEVDSLNASGLIDSASGNARIGDYSRNGPYYADGVIDEVRFSDKARDGNWILTEYNNQSSPSTFYSLGAEEEPSNAPAATLNQPNGNQLIGSTYSVDFNVSDPDNDELEAALYYSEGSGDFNYLIADLNLNDYSNYPGLSCDSTIWLTSTNCTYDWNLYRQGISVKDSSLVLYMPLDTYSYRDFSPLANNGSGPNFDKTSSSGVVTGKQNRAMKFDGADDYISVPDTDRLDMRTSDFSIELWAQRDASGATHVLVDKRSDATNGYVLQFNSSNQIEAQVCDGTCTTITSTDTITDTGWHYIVATFDRSANAQIYLDGVANGSAVDISGKASSNINTSTALRIGARSYGTLANVLDGTIDELRIYDKLLSAAEIRKRWSMIQENDNNRILDGNYYVDLNVWDSGDLNATDSSSTSFAVDNTGPITYDDAPSTQQTTAFTVTFTCRDDYTDQNLVSYWKLDESGTTTTAADSQGSNNGTLTNFDFNADDGWTTGKINNGLKFDGTDDYVNIGDKSDLEGFSQMSISAWIKSENLSGYHFIAGKEGVYKIDTAGSSIRFLTGNDWAGSILTSQTTLSTNEWYHIVATYDGSTKKLYINGVQDPNTVSTSGGVGTNATIATIGSLADSTNFFDGVIDSVRIYNRALTADEVYKHYMYGVASGNYSDCNYVKYRIDSGKWRQSAATIINSDGNHAIQYYSVDKAGNKGATKTVYASLILGGHTFSLGFRFDGNWRSATVHIPGFVSDQNVQNTLTQTFSQGSNIDYMAFYLNNVLLGLASTGATYYAEVTNVDPSLFNAYMQQVYRPGVDEEFYLAYTSGNYRAFEDKRNSIKKKEFLKRVNPAFGISTSAVYTVTMGLDFYDSNIDLNGSLHLGPGTHSIVVKNQGYHNGKTVIQVSES